MSADEFWYAPPALAQTYREAYKLKRRMENERAWLQGLYMYSAFGAVIGQSFGKKGAKKSEYMKEPVDLGLETEAEKEEKAKREREKIIASLTAWKKAWDAAKKGGG